MPVTFTPTKGNDMTAAMRQTHSRRDLVDTAKTAHVDASVRRLAEALDSGSASAIGRALYLLGRTEDHR